MKLVLAGNDVYDLYVDQTPQMTKPKAEGVAPKRYYRAKYDGIGFTVDQKFIDDLNAGLIVRVTLTEGERSVANPLEVGKTKTVKSLAYGSHALKDQLINVAKFNKEIAEIETPAIHKVEVTPELVSQLQRALTAGE